MSHRDAPPETASQIACREFWQKAQPHVTRAWGRAKDGSFLAEESRLLHKAWVVASPEVSCSFNEALVVIENFALRGYQLSGDDALRFRAIADRLAAY